MNSNSDVGKLTLNINFSAITLIIKNVGSVLSLMSSNLAVIGSLAAPFFIFLNIKRFRTFEFIVIIVGFLFYFLDSYSIRVFLSVIIISLMFRSMEKQEMELNSVLFKLLFIGMTLLIFAGLGVSSFYDAYWFGNRYKSFYEDATLLGVYLLPFLSMGVYYFLNSNGLKKKFYLICLALLSICLIMTFSRMYIFLGGVMLVLFLFYYKRKVFNSIVILLSLAVIYLLFKIDWNSVFYSMRLVGDDGGFNLTGRGFIWDMFFRHASGLSSWQWFIPTVSDHLNKLNLELGAEGHSVVENSYYMVFLCGGVLGLILLFVVLMKNIVKNRLTKMPMTIIYLSSIMIVWFFDDSLGFPFSVFCQFFSLFVIFNVEKRLKLNDLH